MTLTWIGRMAEADEVREEALALYETQGQPEQVALAHVRLATSKMHIGQIEAAGRHARIGLALCRKEANHQGAGRALRLLAMLSLIAGDTNEAESLAQESLTSLQKVKRAAEIGWVFNLSAKVARRQGQPAEAKKLLYKGLRTASGVMGMITILIGLVTYLNLLADEGHLERVVEMGIVLEKHPIMKESFASKMLYTARLDKIRMALPPEVAAEAEARGLARNLQKTAKEILVELEEIVMA